MTEATRVRFPRPRRRRNRWPLEVGSILHDGQTRKQNSSRFARHSGSSKVTISGSMGKPPA